MKSCPLLLLTAHVPLARGQPFCLLSSPGPCHEMATNPPHQTHVLQWLEFTAVTSQGADSVYSALAFSSSCSGSKLLECTHTPR